MDIVHRYEAGLRQTKEYVSWSGEQKPKIWVTPGGVPAIELSFQVVIGSTVVRGIIDQVIDEGGGTVRVRDLKTGSTRSKFQLRVYGIALRELYGVEVHAGDWYMAAKGKLSRPVPLSPEDLEEAAQRFDTMDAAVKAGVYRAAPGFQCRFCDVSESCYFFAHK